MTQQNRMTGARIFEEPHSSSSSPLPSAAAASAPHPVATVADRLLQLAYAGLGLRVAGLLLLAAVAWVIVKAVSIRFERQRLRPDCNDGHASIDASGGGSEGGGDDDGDEEDADGDGDDAYAATHRGRDVRRRI